MLCCAVLRCALLCCAGIRFVHSATPGFTSQASIDWSVMAGVDDLRGKVEDYIILPRRHKGLYHSITALTREKCVGIAHWACSLYVPAHRMLLFPGGNAPWTQAGRLWVCVQASGSQWWRCVRVRGPTRDGQDHHRTYYRQSHQAAHGTWRKFSWTLSITLPALRLTLPPPSMPPPPLDSPTLARWC